MIVPIISLLEYVPKIFKKVIPDELEAGEIGLYEIPSDSISFDFDIGEWLPVLGPAWGGKYRGRYQYLPRMMGCLETEYEKNLDMAITEFKRIFSLLKGDYTQSSLIIPYYSNDAGGMIITHNVTHNVNKSIIQKQVPPPPPCPEGKVEITGIGVLN
jgi:hypothetical protein